jgi:hypothetical protein
MIPSVKSFSSVSAKRSGYSRQPSSSKGRAKLTGFDGFLVIFEKYKVAVSAITSIGSFIYYLDCKFSALDLSNVEYRIKSIKTEEKCEAANGNVKIFGEQVIRAEIRNDTREKELRKAIESIRAEMRAEKRWF